MAAMAYSYTNLNCLKFTPTLKTGNSIPCPNFFTPNLGSNFLKPSSYRLKISHNNNQTKKSHFVFGVSSLVDDDDSSSVSSNGPTSEVSFDLKLPRRSLLVQFTCNACGERTERLINRLAYEKGTVFVQCAGCSQYHKLVDNLHLVVEYDLREDVDLDPNTDRL